MNVMERMKSKIRNIHAACHDPPIHRLCVETLKLINVTMGALIISPMSNNLVFEAIFDLMMRTT